MNILQIVASYKPAYIYGGPVLSVSRLCEALAKAKVSLEVLTTTANGPDELAVGKNSPTEVDGVKVSYYKRITKDHTHFSPALYASLRKKIGRQKKNKEEVLVHIHAWWNLVSIFSCLVAKWKGVPVLLTPRGTLSNYSFGNRNAGVKDLIHRFLGKKLLEYSHFHVTSEKEKEDILQLLHPRSIRVIPNFVYLPELSLATANNHSSEPVKLLFLSRIEEKKGLDILFNALSSVSFNYVLNIAGTGEDAYVQTLKKLAADLQITSKINWLGQKSQEEKWDVMQEHDILVLPSHDENFANVVIECLSMGTPVLVTSKVGLADYVERKNFGWVCFANVDSVRTILTKAITDHETIAFTRSNAPSQIRKDFDEKVLVQEFIGLYKELITTN